MISSVTSFRSLSGISSLLVLTATIGCTTTYGGHLGCNPPRDDVILYSAGPEFKIAAEATANQVALEEQAEAQANASAEAANANSQR